jgi:hypothetical protein
MNDFKAYQSKHQVVVSKSDNIEQAKLFPKYRPVIERLLKENLSKNVINFLTALSKQEILLNNLCIARLKELECSL